jgi:ATP-dependent RNA helicase DDX21
MLQGLIIKASKRDLLVSLTEVSADIVELFKPVAVEISQELDLEDALSRALACISGYKDRINQRSMMGSFSKGSSPTSFAQPRPSGQ